MILGLTGGVATGKTTVAAELARLGVRVVDCDAISHFLAQNDPTVLAAIRAAFGDRVFQASGSLDRRALANVVFDDAAARQQLERILHPPIVGICSANITAARFDGQDLVVAVPLLYEGGYQRMFDLVWVVSSTQQAQLERMASRDGLSHDEALKLIGAQMPLSDKELLADRVIVNNGSLQELQQTVKISWEGLTAGNETR